MSNRSNYQGRNAKPGLQKLRHALPWIVLAVAGIGFVFHAGIGTLSDFGWMQVSVLCPLGALGTMLASKLLVPRALVSLAIVAALIVLLGRTFCGWICPIPRVSSLRHAFERKDQSGSTKDTTGKNVNKADRQADDAGNASAHDSIRIAPLSSAEQEMLHKSCRETRGTLDSRHLVLGGAVVSAAIFGFPVFCLICPIGLSFATILLLLRAFGVGDVTWSLIAVPVLLLVEVVFFRKWCHSLCPLGALMSLLGKANRTVRPSIDNNKCLESSKGVTCGACGRACSEGIDPRHPQLGYTQMNECTRCRKCADACPGGAISFPLVSRENKPVALEPTAGKSAPPSK